MDTVSPGPCAAPHPHGAGLLLSRGGRAVHPHSRGSTGHSQTTTPQTYPSGARCPIPERGNLPPGSVAPRIATYLTQGLCATWPWLAQGLNCSTEALTRQQEECPPCREWVFYHVLEPMTGGTFKNRPCSSGRALGDSHNGLSASHRGMSQISKDMEQAGLGTAGAFPGLRTSC